MNQVVQREHAGVAVSSKSYAIADPLTIARVERELEPLRTLAIDGVLRPLALEHGDGQLTILHERETGLDLEQLAGTQGLALEQFLPIAIAMTETLAQLHARGLLHNDLRPSRPSEKSGRALDNEAPA